MQRIIITSQPGFQQRRGNYYNRLSRSYPADHILVYRPAAQNHIKDEQRQHVQINAGNKLVYSFFQN